MTFPFGALMNVNSIWMTGYAHSCSFHTTEPRRQATNCRPIIFKAVALNQVTHNKHSNSPFKTHDPSETNTAML